MPATNINESIIIILNGPSSVGKSSIQKALQKKSALHFLRIGIDTFFDALIEQPDLSNFEQDKKFDQYTQEGEYIRGIEQLNDEDGHLIVPLKIGSAGDRIIYGMHRAIAGYAQAGNNLIVDYILYKNGWMQDLCNSLHDCKVYLIGVHAPLEIIEERELNRNTSPRGHARSHYYTVHNQMIYDIEINTAQFSVEECADKVLEFIKQNQKPEALKENLLKIIKK